MATSDIDAIIFDFNLEDLSSRRLNQGLVCGCKFAKFGFSMETLFQDEHSRGCNV